MIAQRDTILIGMPDGHRPRTAASDRHQIERGVRHLLVALYEDPDRERLRDTPRRVARMYRELFSGLGYEPAVRGVFKENAAARAEVMGLIRKENRS